MSKLNITFNGKAYSIDKALLAGVVSELEATLDTLSNFEPAEPDAPVASVGLGFTLKDDGTYELSRVGTCTDLDVVIPAEVDGIAVTSIGSAVFGYEEITSVIIPDSVTTIGGSAFMGCYNLTSVTIPDSVTIIEETAFSDCSNLTSVTIGNSVATIGECAFYLCPNLTSITIGESVATIGKQAFNFCEALTSITFQGTVEQWNAISFGYDWNLTVPATYVQCSDGQVAL